MSFRDALISALETPNRTDAVARAHDVVRNGIRRLDQGAEVAVTDYFTHTFVPDVIITWGKGTRKKKRHVHLRFRVTAETFESDLRMLESEAPLFIGMTDPEAFRDLELHLGGEDGTTLVTEARAFDAMEQVLAREPGARVASSAMLRYGYGLLPDDRADRLSADYADALGDIRGVSGDDADEAGASVVDALASLGGVLPDDAQAAIVLDLRSRWIQAGRDPEEFPVPGEWNPTALSDDALRELLLALLAQEEDVDAEVWRRTAGFLTPERIGEVLGTNQRGGRFNDLVAAVAADWTARWLWVDPHPSPSLFGGFEWVVQDRRFGLDAGSYTCFFADDGRHFKDKEGGYTLPMLAASEGMLSKDGVVRVGLRGPHEGIRYEPLRDGLDLFGRMHEVLDTSKPDAYLIERITTHVPGSEAIADVNLDRRVVEVTQGSGPVLELTRLAHQFFGSEDESESLDSFLRRGDDAAQGAAGSGGDAGDDGTSGADATDAGTSAGA